MARKVTLNVTAVMTLTHVHDVFAAFDSLLPYYVTVFAASVAEQLKIETAAELI